MSTGFCAVNGKIINTGKYYTKIIQKNQVRLNSCFIRLDINKKE